MSEHKFRVLEGLCTAVCKGFDGLCTEVCIILAFVVGFNCLFSLSGFLGIGDSDSFSSKTLFLELSVLPSSVIYRIIYV